ncbi:MAG: hypothetical protein ACR2HH_11365 [Chthoniobacterales bacterium]
MGKRSQSATVRLWGAARVSRGLIRGVPKIKLHNPVLARENGDEFMRVFHDAVAGLVEPFLLVIEGSIPNEQNKREGF